VSGLERPVTRYAATDFKEYFCESAAAFITPKNEFAPRGLGWLRAALTPIRSRVYGVVSRTRDDLRRDNPSAHAEMEWLLSGGK
jgi:hypothetical protein